MSRQWLNAPGTEAHLVRLEHIKTLGTVGAGRQYLAQVKEEHGSFWAKYLEDEFAIWLAAQKEAA